MIKVSSKENEVIIDPFMGSGTTVIACMNTDRQYIGFEMDEGYYDKSLERINLHNREII